MTKPLPTRRRFLATLAALPVVGRLLPRKAEAETAQDAFIGSIKVISSVPTGFKPSADDLRRIAKSVKSNSNHAFWKEFVKLKRNEEAP